MRVIPVAGRDSMLLNLSELHAPFFIRNLVVITDTSGHLGVGEVQAVKAFGGCWRRARSLVEGRSHPGSWRRIMEVVSAEIQGS